MPGLWDKVGAFALLIALVMHVAWRVVVLGLVSCTLDVSLQRLRTELRVGWLYVRRDIPLANVRSLELRERHGRYRQRFPQDGRYELRADIGALDEVSLIPNMDRPMRDAIAPWADALTAFLRARASGERGDDVRKARPGD